MKLPSTAKKIFSGVIFDVYQWEQKMFDKSTATFEMLKRANTLQVIATRGDKVLISYEEQPMKGKFHTLFGGRQEDDETPLAGIKREFLEESGMVSDDWELFKTCEPYCKVDWTIYTYIARDCKKIQEVKNDPGEKTQTVELNFDEFIALVSAKDFIGKEITLEVLRLRVSGELEKFKKKIFNNT
ncbi:MAG: NUDIX domain-containing protein [Patescibacteria group bacterium]